MAGECSKRYVTGLEEARRLQPGGTGDTFTFEGVLFERLEGPESYCWIAWHNIDRSGCWDLCKENEVPGLLRLYNAK